MTLAQAPGEFLKVIKNKFQGRKCAPRWSVLWVKVIFPGICNNLRVWVKQDKSGSYSRVLNCFEFWSPNWNLENLMQAQDCRFYCWDFLKSWTCPNEKSSSLAKEKGTEKLWNMDPGELPALRKYVQFLYHSERKKKLFCVIVLGFLRRSVSRNSREPQHTS